MDTMEALSLAILYIVFNHFNAEEICPSIQIVLQFSSNCLTFFGYSEMQNAITFEFLLLVSSLESFTFSCSLHAATLTII